MRGRPRVQPSPAEGDQMTNDEIEIALSFLKKRFSDYSLDQILLSLSQHLQQRQAEIVPNNSPYWPEDHEPYRGDFQETAPGIQPRRTRITHNNRDQRQLRQNIFSISANNEEKLNKFEELRLVAKFFCETGINFSLVRYFFPEITPQKYRAYIDTINNQAINEIQKFLRYECNIQIEHLSTDQKRSLKSQLIKVRDWLGQKNLAQLETYYKFIERHYQQKNVDISYDEALKLYKTLLQIIKSPFVDIMEVIDGEDREAQLRTPPRFAHTRTSQMATLTKEEEVRVVETYLKFKTLSRVSEHLNEKWGYCSKWSKPCLKATLRRCLKKSIKKVIVSKNKYLSRTEPIEFTDSEEDLASLFESLQSDAIKDKLFKFYIANRITATGLTNIIKQLNLFFTQLAQERQPSLQGSQDQVSFIPKLEPELPKEEPIPRRRVGRTNQGRRQGVGEERGRDGGDEGVKEEKGRDDQTEATEEQIKQQVTLQNFSRCSFEEVIEID